MAEVASTCEFTVGCRSRCPKLVSGLVERSDIFTEVISETDVPYEFTEGTLFGAGTGRCSNSNESFFYDALGLNDTSKMFADCPNAKVITSLLNELSNSGETLIIE